MKRKWIFIAAMILTVHVSSAAAQPAVDSESVDPGTAVKSGGANVPLYEGRLRVGDDFLKLLESTDIQFPFRDRVTIVSVVPALNTGVCDLQTHNLSNAEGLLPEIDRVTMSRDLPPIQKQFTATSKIANVTFVSDETGAFGRTSGLMLKGLDLLTRAIFVLDEKGIVQYVQVVPELTHLPDLKKAVEVANGLVK